MLREEIGLTRKEMAARLDCSDSTAKRSLQSMVEKGAIKRIEGAFLMGRMWLIPKDAKKPEDPRRVRKIGQDKK